MLYYAHALCELQFGALMQIYLEGNQENAADNYPDRSAGEGLLLAEQDFYAYLRDVFFPTAGALYAIWVENGGYVSALRLEPYQDGLLIEGLETAPDARRNGYAKALMQAVQRDHSDTILYAHIHKKNVPSLALHETSGFSRIYEHAMYIDGSINDRCCTVRWQA